MTDRRPAMPERIISGSHAAGSPEARAADYLRSAAQTPSDLGALALARVAVRLEDGRETPARARLHWRTIVALTVLAVCAGGATGAAVWVMAPRLRARWAPPARSAPLSEAGASAHAMAPRLAVQSTRPELPAPGMAPPVASSPPDPVMVVPQISVAHIRRQAARAEPRAVSPAPSASWAPPTPSPGPEPLARESALVGLALRRLRREHDPRGALAALDEHAAEFAHGVLRPEADMARLEVLLTLDRRSEALAILNGMTFADNARGRELLVIRAELRAGGACGGAIADFTGALLDPALATSLVERALHGRAACYLRTGNSSAAKADLDEYLHRFPDGRFAAETRRSRIVAAPSTDERFPPPSDTGTLGGTR